MRHSVIHYMTAAPHTVGQEQTLSHAEAHMQAHRIRHLPVLHGGALVGLISERDVALGARLGSESLTIEDVMSPAPYTVKSDTAIATVVRHMAEQRVGSAVVVDATEHVLGIFTTVDAMNLLARLLDGSADL